jgi:ATP-binding protein involved in chromosome partitioning
VAPELKHHEEEDLLPEVKNIIAISSGKGGVGKSTVAGESGGCLDGLGYKVGLLDADISDRLNPKCFM